MPAVCFSKTAVKCLRCTREISYIIIKSIIVCSMQNQEHKGLLNIMLTVLLVSQEDFLLGGGRHLETLLKSFNEI